MTQIIMKKNQIWEKNHQKKLHMYANLAILATPVCVIGHQVYVLDPR